MINKTTKTTKIYTEMSETDRKKYFDLTRDKYIAHIDTFYYSAYVDEAFCSDWRVDSIFPEVRSLLSTLKQLKDTAVKAKQNLPVFDFLTLCPFRRFSIYSYTLSVKDKFDIFIADSLPNEKTPPIFIQLRSASLWLDGVYSSFDMSFDAIKSIFFRFGIEIVKLVENRVDYAFHTNYIQDVANFFPVKKLGQMQVSNFEQGNTHFYIYNEETFTDYCTLGRRKSNNVFFRVYDKTKEVIEMGYKHFFIPIWYNQGLINAFDYEVLTNCAKMGNDWHNLDRCRALFYLEHGSDAELKQSINFLFSRSEREEVSSAEFSNLIKGIVPKVTTICNLEFQVKRKFFDRLRYDSVATLEEMAEFEALLDFSSDDSCRGYIYDFLGRTKSITDFLTWNTLRFVKYKTKKDLEVPRSKREVADFWKRLRSCEQLEIVSSDCKLYRDYQVDIDKELVTNKLVSTMATYSAYFSFDDPVAWNADDVSSDILNHLNDNDLCDKFTFKSQNKRKELRKYYNI